MEQKIQQLRELRALTEKRRKLWNESVKNKIIDEVEIINQQFKLGLIADFKENHNYETLIFKTRSRPIDIVYNGHVITQSSGGIVFYQLSNGKIEIILLPAKVEKLKIEYEVDYIELGCYEPEDVSNELIYDSIESWITQLIDFEDQEERSKSRPKL